MAKVVIIGGGSLGFAGGLTRDILSYEATSDAEFVYVDIDPTRLDLGVQYAQRIITEGKYTGAKVSGTLNRREALEGADYIIISILVGGYAAIEKEIDIPILYTMGKEDYLFLGPVKEMVNQHKNSLLLTIQKCGHVCNVESPELFNQHSLEFIGQQHC